MDTGGPSVWNVPNQPQAGDAQRKDLLTADKETVGGMGPTEAV